MEVTCQCCILSKTHVTVSRSTGHVVYYIGHTSYYLGGIVSRSHDTSSKLHYISSRSCGIISRSLVHFSYDQGHMLQYLGHLAMWYSIYVTCYSI